MKSEEFALSNRVKEACELKKDNPNLTAFEISNKMNIAINTVIKYLNIGSRLWDWCNYDGKEEQRKSGRKTGKASGIPLICLTNGFLFVRIIKFTPIKCMIIYKI